MREISVEEQGRTAQGVPEVALWRAVILVLMADLISRRKIEAAQARDWFFNNARDLVTVCGLANLSPEAVKGRARELLEVKRNGGGNLLLGTVAGRTPIKRLQRGHTRKQARPEREQP